MIVKLALNGAFDHVIGFPDLGRGGNPGQMWGLCKRLVQLLYTRGVYVSVYSVYCVYYV